jgi:lipopolysaccharide export system protein LptC
MARTIEPPRARQRRRRRSLIGYSGMIATLKILLPLSALGLILLVALWPQFLLDGGRFRLVSEGVESAGIDRLSMVNPRFEGTDSREQPFTVSAERAMQDVENKDLIELIRPKADITLENGAGVALKAAHGLYRRDREILNLTGGVDLVHDRSTEISTASAEVDLAAGTAEGTEPVAAKGPFGELSSEGFRVADRGAVVEFTGRTRLLLQGRPEGLQ